MKGYKPVNINHLVKVKLNERGLEILREQRLELNKRLPENLRSEFTPPKVDKEGYCKYQLWCLMETFGKYCVLGYEPPFEAEILVEVHDND